jgi:hypothetical protein
MAHDPLIALPETKLVVEAPVQPVAEAPGVELAAPTPDQMRAADGVFTEHHKDSDTIAGLIGMWTGVLLLHDLAVEHLDRPDEDEQAGKPKLPKKDEPAQ